MNNLAISTWLSENTQRKYPLDDMASGVASSGEKLPDSIIADLSISYELIKGTPVFAGIYISNSLLSVTIIAISGTGTRVPLLIGTFHKDSIVPYVPYSLAPVLTAVAAGSITFGNGAVDADTRNYVFTGYDGKISPSCLEPRGSNFVRSIRSYSSKDAAKGDITMSGLSECVVAVGEGGRAIDIGLSDQASADLAASVECQVKPIVGLNNIIPDAQGRIFLRFK